MEISFLQNTNKTIDYKCRLALRQYKSGRFIKLMDGKYVATMLGFIDRQAGADNRVDLQRGRRQTHEGNEESQKGGLGVDQRWVIFIYQLGFSPSAQ